MDDFFQLLNSFHPLSDELKGALIGRTYKDVYRKNRPVLANGQNCDWFGYIEKGFAKLCYDIPDGQERIICFMKEGELVCTIKSNQLPASSRIAIVALEETVVRKISHKDAELIAEKHPLFHAHWRKINEYQTMQVEKHFLLHLDPPKVRLLKLPALLGWMFSDRRIKQYMIADYLGVDRATVSRWRNSKNEKQ